MGMRVVLMSRVWYGLVLHESRVFVLIRHESIMVDLANGFDL